VHSLNQIACIVLSPEFFSGADALLQTLPSLPPRWRCVTLAVVAGSLVSSLVGQGIQEEWAVQYFRALGGTQRKLSKDMVKGGQDMPWHIWLCHMEVGRTLVLSPSTYKEGIERKQG
jgi:hypothetical protein